MLRPMCWATLMWIALLTPCVHSQGVHAFNVEDDIAMVRFNEPRPVPGNAQSEAGVSPDGKYVAVVTTRGLLSRNEVESQLWVFAAKSLKRSLSHPALAMPRPRLLAAAISYPHREQTVPYAALIKDLRWSPSGDVLFFRRETPGGNSELCTYALRSSRLAILSSPHLNVNLFDLSADTVVYTASSPRRKSISEAYRINADAWVGTGLPIYELLFPDEVIQGAAETWNLYVARREGAHWRSTRVPDFALRDRSLLSSLVPFQLSPDHRSVVTLLPVKAVASGWEQYQPAAGAEHLHFDSRDPDVMNPRSGNRPLEYVAIDLATGKQRRLTHAPDGRSLGYTQSRTISWSKDGRRLLLTNTFLPFNIVRDAGREQEVRPCTAAVLELSESQPVCARYQSESDPPNSIRFARFGGSGNEVIIGVSDARGKQGRLVYESEQEHWQLSMKASDADHPDIQDATSLRARVHVYLRQSLNERPVLWTTDDAGHDRALWDPNPQFDRFRFAQARDYRWKDETGTEWVGQLVEPLDYQPGKRYPLVIQVYTIDEGQFLTGGPYPTALAAREMANVGFFVLLAQKKRDTLTEEDPIRHLRAYRSAIDHLDAEGFIDRHRVGVVGFSWSCWYVADGLVRDPDLFAAATIADGLDNSYMQYHFASDVQPIRRQMENIRGTSPFGTGLTTWLRDSPGFNLDRIRAPVRIEAINPASVLQEWELYSSLRMQGKPVDLIYFPKGTHIHQKPQERFESQQGDIDWFRFWLQHYEDPSPGKRAQYERWRKLKPQPDERKKEVF